MHLMTAITRRRLSFFHFWITAAAARNTCLTSPRISACSGVRFPSAAFGDVNMSHLSQSARPSSRRVTFAKSLRSNLSTRKKAG